MARRLLRVQFSRSEEPLPPTLSPRRAGARERISARGNRAYFLTSPRPFAGRGRNSSIARISGEGHGTALVANSILAERRAPHPNPLPAKSGAREEEDQRTRQPCLLPLLPLWEKVARTQSATVEGSASAERTPPSLREGTLSHRGRGEDERASRGSGGIIPPVTGPF